MFKQFLLIFCSILSLHFQIQAAAVLSYCDEDEKILMMKVPPGDGRERWYQLHCCDPIPYRPGSGEARICPPDLDAPPVPTAGPDIVPGAPQAPVYAGTLQAD